MTKQLVKTPSVGESVTEVTLLKWLKQAGENVEAGEPLLEIESDKATVEVISETTGVLEIFKPAGTRVQVGEVVATVDPQGISSEKSVVFPPTIAVASASVAGASGGMPGPAARKLASEQGIPLFQPGSGKDGRLTKGDLLGGVTTSQKSPVDSKRLSPSLEAASSSSVGKRVPMSSLRAKIAERLVQAQHTAAILTTFNEVDLSAVIQIRQTYKDRFKEKFQTPLSFMSFFTLAAIEGLKQIPEVNASIEGRDIVYPDHCHIGIAVGTDRGLVVPVIKEAEQMTLVQIEQEIAQLTQKARQGKLSIQDMSAGTFTLSNGGVYGSLLSTPILNPPQSGILGMHAIQDRPVVREGRIEIRPMMYLALSYDHRLIDGKGAVTFLVILKDCLEHPEKLHLEFDQWLS